MKTPLFNELDRKILRENKSSGYAARVRLYIAVHNLEKAFAKSYVGRLIKGIIDMTYLILNW